MNSGNMLVDRHEKEDIRTYKCCNCNGKGSVKWSELLDGVFLMTVEIDNKLRYLKKKFPDASWRCFLHVARLIRKEGCKCYQCEGTGEVYI